MIYDKPLTEQQRKKSQLNFYCFYAINGISYMCLGETVLILLAVKMQSSDAVISALGAMLYFGYLLLPLGKIVAAQRGGAYSQSFFWICRNIAAMLVAASAVLKCFDFSLISTVLLLSGAFFFYGFRAAGVVMSQPLIGDISGNDSGRVLAVSNGIFFLSRMSTILAITLIIKYNDSLTTLIAITVFGAISGITSSKFLRNIDETDAICKSARKPLAPEIKWGMKSKVLRRQLTTGFICNLAWIMTVPITTLALKRGYNASDAEALIFTISLSAGASIMSFASGKISKLIGPRRHLILSHILLTISSFAWLLMPAKMPFCYMLFHFLILGTVTIWNQNASINYFLKTIPQEHRVGGSILHAVVTGVFSGLTGIAVTGFMLEFIPRFTSTPLDGYKLYFIITGITLAASVYFFFALTPLPEDKRSFARLLKNARAIFISRRH